jgi:3-dehydroquinate synthase
MTVLPDQPIVFDPPPGGRQVTVRAGNAECRIFIFEKALDQFMHRLADAVRPAEALVITDSNVRVLYGDSVAGTLRRTGLEPRLLAIPPGEGSKSLTVAASAYDALAEAGGARDTVVVGVGGGVVGDVAGFVAATWVRGVRLVLIPTSLEAAIDASIGGKNAVNHPAGKNLIGTFHQPWIVLIDTACLDTLPDRDLRAGLAESIKHAVICDAAFFEWHERHLDRVLAREPAALLELIERNVAIKAAVVEADPLETTGQRAWLNYGHTIGHAIEASLAAAGDDPLRHGEAVAVGMHAANHIAMAHVGMPAADAERVRALFHRAGLAPTLPRSADRDDILDRIRFDKKRSAVGARFVLCRQIGEAAVFDDVPPSLVERAVRSLV